MCEGRVTSYIRIISLQSYITHTQLVTVSTRHTFPFTLAHIHYLHFTHDISNSIVLRRWLTIFHVDHTVTTLLPLSIHIKPTHNITISNTDIRLQVCRYSGSFSKQARTTIWHWIQGRCPCHNNSADHNFTATYDFATRLIPSPTIFHPSVRP